MEDLYFSFIFFSFKFDTLLRNRGLYL